MKNKIRLILGLIISPMVPSALLVVGAFPNCEIVAKVAKQLLLYSYPATFLMAIIGFLFFKDKLNKNPFLMILAGAVCGSFLACMPFLKAIATGHFDFNNLLFFLYLWISFEKMMALI
jgi:hypothetical protein